MSSEVVEQLKEQYKDADTVDTYSGSYGSSEHSNFIKSCRDRGGQALPTDDRKTLECRKK